jgi:peptidyl-prolyl cis-trans isomerase C
VRAPPAPDGRAVPRAFVALAGASGTPGPVAAFLREPLLHFVLGGALLFSAYAWLAPRAPDASSDTIVVTDAHMDAWRKELARIHGREPTDEEIAAVAREFVDEEILYREALALGLDSADLVVRRRLAQKMRFLLEDTMPLAPATDAELATWYDEHRAEFAEPARVSVTQVFVSADAHGDEAAAVAARLRERLAAAGAPAADGPGLGDAFPAGSTFEDASERELANYFGAALAARVMELPIGEWSEPIASAWGVHVLRVSTRTAAREPPLSEIRERVAQAYEDARRDAANDARMAELRARYDVRLPPLAGGEP